LKRFGYSHQINFLIKLITNLNLIVHIVTPWWNLLWRKAGYVIILACILYFRAIITIPTGFLHFNLTNFILINCSISNLFLFSFYHRSMLHWTWVPDKGRNVCCLIFWHLNILWIVSMYTQLGNTFLSIVLFIYAYNLILIIISFWVTVTNLTSKWPLGIILTTDMTTYLYANVKFSALFKSGIKKEDFHLKIQCWWLSRSSSRSSKDSPSWSLQFFLKKKNNLLFESFSQKVRTFRDHRGVPLFSNILYILYIQDYFIYTRHHRRTFRARYF